MSIRLMTIVWDIPWPSQSALLIALKLADYANDEGGSIYPARDTLAQHAHTSLATVKRVLKGFRDCGVLHVVREGGAGPGSTTEYRLDVGVLMRLHDGYSAFKKDANSFEIEDTAPVDSVDEKGLTVSPYLSTRGSPDAKRGSLDAKRGSPSEPQPTNLKPPIRTTNAHAREDFNSQNEKKKSWSSTAAIHLTPKDGASWKAWLDHLRANGNAELAGAAELGGHMTVAARWPKDGVSLPRIDMAPAEAKVVAERIIGERAE